QYREGIQVMQLYDLRIMKIQQIFNIYEEKNHSNKYSKSILAVSKNEQMIAFSSEYRKITLYLIENGLEIICKDFGKNTKIIACEFKDDDKLMIIIKKSNDKYIKLLLWYLYTNKFQDYDKHFELKEDEESIFYSITIPGKYVFIYNNGTIFSVYDSLLKIDDKKKVSESNQMKELKYDNNDNIAFNQDQIKIDAQPIKDELEPWITDNYTKKWVYLDQKESV
ncbi:9889_t:CDS:1, partial [Funneliformis geosporum]